MKEKRRRRGKAIPNMGFMGKWGNIKLCGGCNPIKCGLGNAVRRVLERGGGYMDKLERLINENRHLKDRLEAKDDEISNLKYQISKLKRKHEGNYSDRYGMAEDCYDFMTGMSLYEELGVTENGDGWIGVSEPKRRTKSGPKVTREQELSIVRYLKRKKCVQVTKKLRGDIYKKFGVSLTDKGIRDLMRRNGIYKGGK